MKKASKIITLILVVALLVSVFAGCTMFGKDVDRYRSTVLVQVGDQTITVGELLDSFNTQYNNYYYYISNGYFTVEQVFEIAATTLYEQAIKVDAYVSSHDKATQNETYVNGAYLDASELNFVVRYVKYLVFTNFDSQVETFLAEDFEFSAKETEDTSRDFKEYDDLEGKEYSRYVYSQNFVNEEMDEYMSDYYAFINLDSFAANTSLNDYVYANETDASEMLKSYNDRLDEEATQLTFEELKRTQEKVLRHYQDSIKATYDFELETFVKSQIEQMIKSIIVAKYNFEIYSKIDDAGADKAKTIKALVANAEGLAINQGAGYILNDNFDSVITSLTDSTYLYAVDEVEAGKYIFVKNILIPFSTSQTNALSNLAQTLGGTESQAYLDARKELVKDIVADDFTSEKDDDGNYAVTVEDIFDIDSNGNIIIKTGAENNLSKHLGGGVVTPMEGKTATETVVELMKQYNTDTAQHANVYDYVVRVEDDDYYTQPWVTEFVDAAKEVKGKGVGNYSICVSSYGVHIVYYSGNVTKQDFDANTFDSIVGNGNADTTSFAYSMFKSYFETQSNSVVSEDLKELKDKYFHLYEEGKVYATKEFDKFIKDNEMEFDFATLVQVDEDSHEGHNH